VQIREPPCRNSGFLGGKFLARTKLATHGKIKHALTDFYVGAALMFCAHEFSITDADEFTLRHMETHSFHWTHSDILLIVPKLQSRLTALKTRLATATSIVSGRIPYHVLEESIHEAQIGLIKQVSSSSKLKCGCTLIALGCCAGIPDLSARIGPSPYTDCPRGEADEAAARPILPCVLAPLIVSRCPAACSKYIRQSFLVSRQIGACFRCRCSSAPSRASGSCLFSVSSAMIVRAYTRIIAHRSSTYSVRSRRTQM
jgi:hypothetical protein